MNKLSYLFVIPLFISFLFFSCEQDTPNEIDVPEDTSDEEVVDDPQDPKDPEEPVEITEHPFLIVTKDLYPALREKASREPWKSMKTDAISLANKFIIGEFNSEFDLQQYIGCVALAYILDEKNSATHANRVYNTIKNHCSQLVVDESAKNWKYIVPPLGALFVATLALDIVYDALTEQQIAECEDIISFQIKLAKITGSWADARRGAHGTWNIYKGIRTTADDDYFDGIMQQITPDGVSPVTNTYAWARVGGSNTEVAKSAYMDVLEFTGIDRRYYNNDRIIKFQRWLYGSSVDCAKNYVIFGDMLATAKPRPTILSWRVVNYDHEAAQYAAWLFEGRTPPVHLLSYILPKSALPEPKTPSSMIYENGGAFLRDKEDDPNGLQLTLYNIKTQDEYHTHNEVNALSLSALGNRLLVNGGRLGAPVRPAYLNNTLTINSKNHSTRVGDGILRGFTSDDLDFAVGAAGPAVHPASHLRNAILVHATPHVPGYFVIFDEVSSNRGDLIKNYLHPANETTIAVVSALTEYKAVIDHYPTVANVSASFYYLTPPKGMKIEKVKSAIPSSYPDYPDHNRLEATYDVDESGNKNLATIVYPFSNKLQKPSFENIGTDEYNACVIPHGIAMDYIVESKTDKQIEFAGIKALADFCMVREAGGEQLFYLVKNGLSFTSTEYGFESTENVTIYANGTKGTILSQGANLKLTGAGMDKVNFSPSVEVVNSGAGFIEVRLGKGVYNYN